MRNLFIFILIILFFTSCSWVHTHEEKDIEDVIDYYEDKIEEELKCPEEIEVECSLCHDTQ